MTAHVSPNRNGRAEYRPFGNVAQRNVVQARLELPLLLRAFGVADGQHILEIGGSGVALGVLAVRCAPARLVGIDIDGATLVLA